MEKIKFKRTSTAGVTPTVAQCDKGELVINSTDRKLFTQDESGNVVELGASLAERYAMPKVQFDANREMNKAKYAGSGFVEWGNHIFHKMFQNIPQGLSCNPTSSTQKGVWFGSGIRDRGGISKSLHPIVNVDGVVQHINQINYNDSQGNGYSTIHLPDAPDGTKSYDSASGIVTDHLTYLDPKYDNTAAADHNEAVSRCFEGVIKNGDFRLGTEGWENPNPTSGFTFTALDGVASASTVAGDNIYNSAMLSDSDTGEVFVHELTGIARVQFGNGGGGIITLHVGLNKFKGSRGGGNGIVLLLSANTTIKFSNVSLRPITSAPILTRQDLVFVEVNPDAECTVFKPLGNNQYGAATADGITLKKLTDLGISQSVSGFGVWDSETVGYGELISSLTDAQLKTVLSNPKNNIRFDPIQNKLLQSEYKICVDEGCNDTDTVDARMTKLGYVKDTVDVTRYNHADGRQAIGVCLRQTLNSGAYHPEFNSGGCGIFYKIGNGYRPWYYVGVSDDIHSTKDCCEYYPTPTSKWTPAPSGSITTINSGRPTSFPDAYYDAIYAHQIKDLRLSAHKQDVNKLRVDAMRKAVSGEMRGWGKVPFTTVNNTIIGTGTHPSKANGYDLTAYIYAAIFVDYRTLHNMGAKVGDTVYVVNNENGNYFKSTILTVSDSDYLYCEKLPAIENHGMPNHGYGLDLSFILEQYLTPQNDTLAWIDLIGSPSNILATFKDGVQGMWIPDVRLGVPLMAVGNRKINTTSLNPIYTLDNGATWLTNTASVNQVTNEWQYGNTTGDLVGIYSYPTLANFTEPANNAKVVGEMGDVIITTRHEVNQGNRLHESLLGNIGKDTTDSLTMVSKTKQTATSMSHQPHDFDIPANNSTGCKVATSIIEKDGLLYSQYQSQEIQFNKAARDWGDNLAIPAVNGDATNVDANDITVKVSNHIDLIPLGIASHSDSSQSS